MLIDVKSRVHHMVSLNPMQAPEDPHTDAGSPLNSFGPYADAAFPLPCIYA